MNTYTAEINQAKAEFYELIIRIWDADGETEIDQHIAPLSGKEKEELESGGPLQADCFAPSGWSFTSHSTLEGEAVRE